MCNGKLSRILGHLLDKQEPTMRAVKVNGQLSFLCFVTSRNIRHIRQVRKIYNLSWNIFRMKYMNSNELER